MKIIVIVVENLYSNIIFQALLNKKNKGNEIIGIVKIKGVFPKKNIFLTLKKILKNYSIYFFTFKVCETIIYNIICCYISLLDKISINSKIRIRPLAKMAHEKNFPIYKVKNINDPEIISLLKKSQPDLIISISANQKFGSNLISIPKKGCINIHSSFLPFYRGVASYFWTLFNKERESGVTIHYIDEKFDTGPILIQKKIRLNNQDSVQDVFLKCAFTAQKLLDQVLLDISNNQITTKKQNTDHGSYYSWPKSKDYKKFKQKNKKLWNLKKYLKSFLLEED